IEELPHRTNDTVNVLERRDYAESIWGNLDQVAESENSPKYLVRRIKEENAEFPEVYIACGEQDSLRDVNLDMYHFLKENGVNAVY
ncbi:alpha/beta hydrolase, partial [Blautia marasmi]|nr:alpha/beta hydrolase [Blautia marasmi]